MVIPRIILFYVRFFVNSLKKIKNKKSDVSTIQICHRYQYAFFFFYFKIPIYMYVCVIDDPLIVAIHLFANIFLLYALG